MKRFLSLFAIVMMVVSVCAQPSQPLRDIKEMTYTFDFQNNNGNWPVGEGENYADGNLTAPLVAGPADDQVLLTGIQGESTNPPRIMNNTSRGICLWVFKGTSIKLSAAEGRAIKKVEVTMQSNSFDLTADNGEVAEGVWTGNASEVTFTNAKGTRYIWQVKVTVTNMDDETYVPVVEPIVATFDFSDPNFRDTIGEKVADPKGNIYNETFEVEGVTLQITSGSAASKIYADNNRGQNLVTYKEYATLTFRAPEGKAIISIEFTAAGNSNINNFSASSGAIEGMTWTGNAEGVRFTQGGTSYLANAIVTLVNKDAETAALPAIEYVECANIAAFNALENGTYAKVTLSNAEITGISADGFSTAWMQDATGGCWIQYSSLIVKYLMENTKLNGFFYVVKRATSGNTQMKEAEDTPNSNFTAEPIGEPTMIEGTLAEVNVAENLNRVVKIKNASFVATSATAGTLTQGDAEISVNNGNETANQQLHKITDTWVKEETTMEKVTIVAILAASSATKNVLLPISMVSQTVGISNVSSDNNEVSIYSLQGLKLQQLQKGINIVNGKKLVVK